MTKSDLSLLRNIGIIAHIDAGKTTLTERVLYYTRSTYKMGDVDDGTTVTDYLKEEQERGITITSAAVTCKWKECTINLIDTPGHVDFTAEVERSLRVLDGGIVIFSGVEGVEAQSETVWRQADKYHVPRLAFINKMDRVGADFAAVFTEIKERLESTPIAVQIPIGVGPTFQGVVDLIEQRAYFFDPDSLGATVEEKAIPDELLDEATAWRDRLFDTLTHFDESDRLTSAYLEGQSVAPDVVRSAIRHACLHRGLVPVFCGSAFKYIGVQRLLDGVAYYLPSPLDIPPVEGTNPKKKDKKEKRQADPKEPFCGLIFKIHTDQHGDLSFLRIYSGRLEPGTRLYNPRSDGKETISHLWRIRAGNRERTDVAEAGDIIGVVGLKDTVTGDTLCDTRHPILLERIEFPETVMSMSIEPASSADKNKLMETLRVLSREDPTFEWRLDEETGQTIMSGMGELHLEVLRNRMLDDFNLKAKVGKPRVSYRETIAHRARAWGEFIHQSGGHGHGLFARVEIEVEPFKGEESISIRNKLKPGVIPQPFVPAIEGALHDEARSGGTLGYPLINVQITVLDAEAHETDSTEPAFRAAASDALRKAIKDAGIVLLEPIMRLEISVPDEYFGDVIADLNSRRAEITDTHSRGKLRVIEAHVPLDRMFGYASAVRSVSQGRASYTLEPFAYAPAPEEKVKALFGEL